MKNQNWKESMRQKFLRFSMFCAFLLVNYGGPNREIPEWAWSFKVKKEPWVAGIPFWPHPISDFRNKMAELEANKNPTKS